MTCIPIFFELQGMPGTQANLVTDDSNWARTNVKTKFNATVHQAQRHEVTSTFILAIVENQTCTKQRQIQYTSSNIHCVYKNKANYLLA